MLHLNSRADSPHWSDTGIGWARLKWKFTSDWLSWWVQTVQAASAGKAWRCNADKSICVQPHRLGDSSSWSSMKLMLCQITHSNICFKIQLADLGILCKLTKQLSNVFCMLYCPVCFYYSMTCWGFEMGDNSEWVTPVNQVIEQSRPEVFQWLENLLCSYMALTLQLDNQQHFSKTLRLQSQEWLFPLWD